MGLAISTSSKLEPFVAEVTPDDEHIMQMRLEYNLGFMSSIAVNAPAEIYQTEEMGVVCTKLASILPQCTSRRPR